MVRKSVREMTGDKRQGRKLVEGKRKNGKGKVRKEERCENKRKRQKGKVERKRTGKKEKKQTGREKYRR